MIDDPGHDESGAEPAIRARSHASEPDPDHEAPGEDELASHQPNKADPSPSAEGQKGAGRAAYRGEEGPAGSRDGKAARAEEEIRDAEEMTNDSALPGLVSEDIGGAGAALNSML